MRRKAANFDSIVTRVGEAFDGLFKWNGIVGKRTERKSPATQGNLHMYFRTFSWIQHSVDMMQPASKSGSPISDAGFRSALGTGGRISGAGAMAVERRGEDPGDLRSFARFDFVAMQNEHRLAVLEQSHGRRR